MTKESTMASSYIEHISTQEFNMDQSQIILKENLNLCNQNEVVPAYNKWYLDKPKIESSNSRRETARDLEPKENLKVALDKLIKNSVEDVSYNDKYKLDTNHYRKEFDKENSHMKSIGKSYEKNEINFEHEKVFEVSKCPSRQMQTEQKSTQNKRFGQMLNESSATSQEFFENAYGKSQAKENIPQAIDSQQLSTIHQIMNNQQNLVKEERQTYPNTYSIQSPHTVDQNGCTEHSQLIAVLQQQLQHLQQYKTKYDGQKRKTEKALHQFSQLEQIRVNQQTLIEMQNQKIETLRKDNKQHKKENQDLKKLLAKREEALGSTRNQVISNVTKSTLDEENMVSRNISKTIFKEAQSIIDRGQSKRSATLHKKTHSQAQNRNRKISMGGISNSYKLY